MQKTPQIDKKVEYRSTHTVISSIAYQKTCYILLKILYINPSSGKFCISIQAVVREVLLEVQLTY